MAIPEKRVLKKRGPKGVKIDINEFEKLCAIQCTLIEIAGWFQCSEDTIENWCKKTYKQKFSDVYRLKRQTGKVSLRRKQFQTALEGNTTLLIWLGKQYLNQSEVIISDDDPLNHIEPEHFKD